METILKSGYYKIIKLFYEDKNKKIHLREIVRKTGLNENSVTRFLKEIEKQGILRSERDGNMKKFYLDKKFIPIIFPLFDYKKLES